MKKIILLTLFSLTMFSAHSQWISINSPSSDQLLNITFTSPDTGFICGRDYILKSTDEGITWDIVHTISFSMQITDICFPEPSTGYASADNMLLKSLDGGESWLELGPPTSSTIRSIYFLNSDTGFICGQGEEIWRTNDGGTNWIQQNAGAYWLRGFSFPYPGTGYCIGDGETVYKTVDNGQNWALQHSNGVINFTDLSFISASTGFVSGYSGYVGKTINGGVTWQQFVVPVSLDFEGIWALDEQNIYVAGQNGTILNTNDGGLTWNLQLSGTASYLRKMFFFSSGNGFIVGHEGTILSNNVTAVNEHPGEVLLSVFPVPATDKLTIRTANEHPLSSAEIFNIRGIKVFSEVLDPASVATLEFDLNPGMYMLVASTKDGYRITRKVIVE